MVASRMTSRAGTEFRHRSEKGAFRVARATGPDTEEAVVEFGRRYWDAPVDVARRWSFWDLPRPPRPLAELLQEVPVATKFRQVYKNPYKSPAPPAGFEPATRRLEGGRSVH